MPLDGSALRAKLDANTTPTTKTLDEELSVIREKSLEYDRFNKKYYIKRRLDVHTIKLVIGIFSNRQLLISQNSISVATCNLVAAESKEQTYYTPHGAVDYFIRFALGRAPYGACGCHKERHLSDEGMGYMKMLERQHNKIHALRRKAVLEENEFNELLMV